MYWLVEPFSGRSFRRSKELAIAKELGAILENPDKTESFELYNSGGVRAYAGASWRGVWDWSYADTG